MGLPVISATIASGESLTSAINLGGGVPVGLIFPSAWTAASLTLQGSPDGVTYYDIYDIYGTEVSITVTAGKIASLGDVAPYLAFSYLKLRSGTTSSAVNQAAARTFGVIVQQIV